MAAGRCSVRRDTAPDTGWTIACPAPATDHAGMLPARTRSRAVAALLGLVAFGLLLTGCSTSTPLCNQAAALLPQGRPVDAMALYARAGDQDEGNCASNGLSTAGAQIGRAAQQESKGAEAEQNGDKAGATAAYQEALKLNSGDARAAAGLVRLGQQVGTPAPAQIPALPPSAAPTGWSTSDWPLIIGGFLLVVALAAAGYALFRNDALGRRMAGLQTAVDNPAAQPVADPAVVDDVRRRAETTAGALDALTERCAAIEGALARLETGSARRDRLVELLAEQLAGPPAGGVLHEQLFDGPPAPAGAGSGVVDVELVAVRAVDGSRRTLAQRVRWTPPDDAAAAALLAQLGPDPATVADVLATGTVTPVWARSTELWLLPETVSADPAAGPLATLVAGGAVRDDELQRLTAHQLAPDTPTAFLARLVTVAAGARTHASLSSEAHDVASGIAAAELEAAAGLSDPAWAGATGRTPGPPAELDRLLGRPSAEPDDRPTAPIAVRVVADPLEEQPAVAGAGLRPTLRIERVAVDVDGVVQALNRSAADAARALAEQPTDAAAIEAFRGALRPASGPAPTGRHQQPPIAAVPIGVSTIACDIVAVGDPDQHPLDFGYRLGSARLDLARMLKDSAELTIAFGAQLAAVRTGDVRRPFDAALREVVGPEQLGPVTATLAGRRPTLTAGPGASHAVDTAYAAASEPPGVDESDDDEQPNMYAALSRKHSGP